MSTNNYYYAPVIQNYFHNPDPKNVTRKKFVKPKTVALVLASVITNMMNPVTTYAMESTGEALKTYAQECIIESPFCAEGGSDNVCDVEKSDWGANIPANTTEINYSREVTYNCHHDQSLSSTYIETHSVDIQYLCDSSATGQKRESFITNPVYSLACYH